MVERGEELKIFFSFKYKLSLLMFFIVIIVSSLLGIVQYHHMKNELVSGFEYNKSLVKDRIVNSVNSADHMYYLLETQLSVDAEKTLNLVLDKYHEENRVNFDLRQFLDGKEYTDLYVIDSNNMIVASTDEVDLGLDFNKNSTSFVEELDNIRKNGVFVSTRIDLSTINAVAKKYCYLPSPDGKYIFEIGFLLDQYEYFFEGIGFDSFESEIIKGYEFVDDITLYDNEGISYRKSGGNKRVIEEKQKEYYRQAIDTFNIVEVNGEINGKEVTYWYVPYKIINYQGINDTNVIEIIFNYSLLERHLIESKNIIIMLGFSIGVIALVLGFYLSGHISKPVESFTVAVKKISDGNFSSRIELKSNDEFGTLAFHFNKMIEDIEELLEERYNYERKLEEKNEEILEQKEEITLLYEETTAINDELEILIKQNNRSYFETVKALASVVEAKDLYTSGHCERVTKYSLAIAESLNLDEQQKSLIQYGSALHDIGKIAIPEQLLNKEGKITEEEYEIIKKHPQIGYEILSNLAFLRESSSIVIGHHERIDGKGYPNGLKGEQIDLLTKIVCVADAFDAMTTIRPYRNIALTKEEAIQEMLRNADKQFDSYIVDVFVEWLKDKDIT